jgi:hypothetical protein
MSIEKIINRKPVNKTTALVALAQTTELHQVDIIEAEWHRLSPFPLKKVPPATIDLTGLRVGRLTVVGLCDETRQGKKARWCVRCDCGSHERRTAKGMQSESSDRCQACEMQSKRVFIRFCERHGRKPTNAECDAMGIRRQESEVKHG